MSDALPTFELLAIDGGARAGRLALHRGIVETPIFMPVGTVGTVKGLYLDQVEGTGADARAQVNFPRHGVKWLALSVAKLTVV